MAPIPEEEKPFKQKWWKSRTLWINAAAVVVQTADYVFKLNIINPAIMGLAMAGINLILRPLTKKELVL